MRRYLSPFLLLLALILGLVAGYTVWRTAYGPGLRLLLALPFLFVWLIPARFWVAERDALSLTDHVLQYVGFLSMGWLSFFFVFTVLGDVLLLVATWTGLVSVVTFVASFAGSSVPLLTLVSMGFGALYASTGPRIKEVSIVIADLPPELDGWRIAQISDLHVGPTIKRRYVQRVVDKANALAPDLVALTGDIVDGRLAELKDDVAPLGELTPRDRVYYITGNHEYYAGGPAGPDGLSGAQEWLAHFRRLGHHVLTNSHATIAVGQATVLVAGVLDPAARLERRDLGPDPVAALGDPAAAAQASLRILLAHNPKLTAAGAKAGFDLQLSGHTHAGQFFPWTLVARAVHAPHFAGLSQEGKMKVYVSAGTGTWGPPIRLGTRPELTLLKLVRGETSPT